jgi:hypothetical protein
VSDNNRIIIAIVLCDLGAAAVFAPSAAASDAESRAPISRERQTSFELVKNQIVVRAELEGRGPFSCIVDTAVDPSVVDIALARRLGLSVSAQGGAAEGIGTDTVAVYPTRLAVGVGGSPGAPIPAVAMSLAALSKRLGRALDCVLGQSWLARRAVEIDYPRERIRFSGAGLPRPPDTASCVTFPMKYWSSEDRTPLVEVQVNGVPIPVSLDTGSSGTLTLFPDSIAAVDVDPPSAQDRNREVMGARGTAVVTDAVASSIRFGPLAAADVKIAIRDRNQDEPPGRMGNLGNGLLRSTRLTLDYPGRKLVLCVAN